MTTPIAQALFGRLFDNAAMYPPARAPMEAALALHDAAERAPWGFARGRFLCPGARLDDLTHELRILGRDNRALRVGAVIGSPADVNDRPPLDQVVAAVERLRRNTPAVHVDLLEVRPSSQDPAALALSLAEAADACETAGADTLMLEIGVAGTDPSLIRDRVDAVADAADQLALHVGVKVRCGGLEPGMVPTRAQLATFLHATNQHGLAFKATAGLHHAFSDPVQGHVGFVSLLLASILSRTTDAGASTIEGLLATSSATDVRLTDHSVAVTPLTGSGGLGAADVDAVAAARYRGFVAFGTCSFTEPAHHAQRLVDFPVGDATTRQDDR